MIKYEIKDKNKQPFLETSISGKALLSIPQLNKGTAFTLEERKAFGLLGKLPERVETLEEQVARAYQRYHAYVELLNRNIYLNDLLNTNQILFYKLLMTHLAEVLPTVYTPIVGSAVQTYNRTYTRPRGIYISYPNRDHMEDIFANRSHPHVELTVVTDGEGVLGIGDQGIGAMDIPVAKLAVYTAFAHVNPMHVLPIMLDVGTNNSQLLNDPLYLGWRHPRIKGQQYRDFLDQFIATIKKQLPDALIHWEDLGRNNAQWALDRYRHEVCSFNDDIEGTGIVCLAALLAALKKTGGKLVDQKIVVFGAGTAGVGISHHIQQELCRLGLDEEHAAACFWLVDRNGLITDNSISVTEPQQAFARSQQSIQNWSCANSHNISLFDVIKNVKPTILIGCSAQRGAFDQSIVTEMAKHVERPIILPLSNPNDKAEASPSNLYRWTDGKVLTATGSPFPAYEKDGVKVTFSQCNNYLAFPGLGLGAIAIKARSITANMLGAASAALGKIPLDSDTLLLPSIEQAQEASLQIACAVASAAREDGVAAITDGDIETIIKAQQWQPQYLPYQPKS